MVGSLPAGARVTAVPPLDGRYVLAFGEQTGHAHAVPEVDAELLDVATADQVDRYLRVRSRTVLHHEEHAPIILEPGLYHVGIQRSFTPSARDLARRVSD
jgi:hypothetical protein